MTSGLRKAHKYIWLLLIVIVPAIMFFSIKDIAILESSNKKEKDYSFTESSLKKDFENHLIKVAFYENNIEIILKTTLKNSSSIVYAVDAKGNKQYIIGQLTSAGIYNFKSNNIPKNIVIFDGIKDVLITKTDF